MAIIFETVSFSTSNFVLMIFIFINQTGYYLTRLIVCNSLKDISINLKII